MNWVMYFAAQKLPSFREDIGQKQQDKSKYDESDESMSTVDENEEEEGDCS